MEKECMPPLLNICKDPFDLLDLRRIFAIMKVSEEMTKSGEKLRGKEE